MAKAKRGFFPAVWVLGLFVLGSICFWGHAWGRVVEDRLGDNVTLRRPVPQVQQTAALAAKREVSVLRRIRGGFTNGAAVRHRCCRDPSALALRGALPG